VLDPLAWAIFAHEIGHQYHHDTRPEREAVPSAIKELEADRFAGYTLEKLKIRATDLSPYWNLTGDEFGAGVSAHNQHGSSAQRVAAFKQGWNLAEWNRPENSRSVAEADSEAVAPDTADGAPK
jgi:predicted metalloprotease